jgi:hypothetical protein
MPLHRGRIPTIHSRQVHVWLLLIATLPTPILLVLLQQIHTPKYLLPTTVSLQIPLTPQRNLFQTTTPLLSLKPTIILHNQGDNLLRSLPLPYTRLQSQISQASTISRLFQLPCLSANRYTHPK